METEEILEVLQKGLDNQAEYQKGSQLALGALAETLQKQDETLNRVGEFLGYLVQKAEEAEEEEDEERAKDEEEEELEKMMSFLAKHFVLKGEFPPSGPDSSEGKARLREDEQRGADEDGERHERDKGTGQKTQPIIQAAEDNKDDGDEDEDDEGKEEDKKDEEYPKVEQLEKMVRALTAQLTDLKKGMDARVKEETGIRLAKLGFKEESSLTAPKRVAPTERTDIVKSRERADVQNELDNLSWSQLVNLRMQADTNSLPDEVKQLIS